jgi:4-hydroxy-tetrahydrodipicolinate synthase
MAHAYLDGELEKARRMQLQLLPLIGALFAEANPIPVKAAVEWLGFETGAPRLPLTPITPAIRERLVAELGALGVKQRR